MESEGGSIVEEPYKILSQLAVEQGLKAIIERLRYAMKLGADTESELTWDHFVRAHLMIARSAQAPKHGWI